MLLPYLSKMETDDEAAKRSRNLVDEFFHVLRGCLHLLSNNKDSSLKIGPMRRHLSLDWSNEKTALSRLVQLKESSL